MEAASFKAAILEMPFTIQTTHTIALENYTFIIVQAIFGLYPAITMLTAMFAFHMQRYPISTSFMVTLNLLTISSQISLKA